MRSLLITDPALTDLEEISAYIARDDIRAAYAVIRRIEEDIETVRIHPGLGKEVRPNVYVRGGTRRQPFRFTYRFSDQRLEVLRVFRGTRNDIPL